MVEIGPNIFVRCSAARYGCTDGEIERQGAANKTKRFCSKHGSQKTERPHSGAYDHTG